MKIERKFNVITLIIIAGEKRRPGTVTSLD